jgi:GPH family glycoside/pentoside/hexuronide:cation symporter
MALIFGQMLFFVTPVIAKALGRSDTNELNLGALGVTAIICAVLLPLTTLYAVWKVPAGEGALMAPGDKPKVTIGESLRAIGRNKPLLRFLAAFAPVSFLGGMASGISFIFLDSFLQLSNSFAAISALSLLVTLGGVPFWRWLSMKYERHRVWAVSMIAGAIAYSGMAFVTPGPGAFIPVLLLYPITVLCLIGVFIAMAMMGDIVDYGRLQTGEDLSGTYAAILSFLQKSALSVAGAAGLAVVGWFGYDAAAAFQSASGAFGIRLVAVIIPASGLAWGAFLIWSFPLTRKKMDEVRAALAAGGVRTTP